MAPAELEAVLLSHPQVADAGVVGQPDPKAGELPTAWVVKKAGATVTEKELEQFVSGTHLGKRKSIREMDVIRI